MRSLLSRGGRLGLLLSLAAAGCSDEEVPEGCSPPPQSAELTEAAADHACMHVVHGPFESVAASADPEAPGDELRNVHTAYTVALVRGQDGYGGASVFEPRVDATFAFFVAHDTSLSLLDAAGEEVCPRAVQPANACPELGRAVFFDLRRKAPNRLLLGSAEAPEVLVIIEEMGGM
ncbi:hypothetical protein WMF20_30255 [Sorangium sp. So ce834]|uniref:hypothetical protein n=1 Tax=Sorangium sp. So ce834 TaxID=3133321 RepID=UPI003F5EB1D3